MEERTTSLSSRGKASKGDREGTGSSLSVFGLSFKALSRAETFMLCFIVLWMIWGSDGGEEREVEMKLHLPGCCVTVL